MSFFDLNILLRNQWKDDLKLSLSALVCYFMLRYMACTGLVQSECQTWKTKCPSLMASHLEQDFYQYFLLIYQSKYVFNQLQVLYRCDLSVCKSEWINDRTNKNVQNCCTSANLAVMPHILLESDSNQWRETLFSNLIFSKCSGLYNFLLTIW